MTDSTHSKRQPASSCQELYLSQGIPSAMTTTPTAGRDPPHTLLHNCRDMSQQHCHLQGSKGKAAKLLQKSHSSFSSFSHFTQMWKNHLLLKKSSISKQDFSSAVHSQNSSLLLQLMTRLHHYYKPPNHW